MKDEVYIRKLVADGEGTGEVRRFELVLASLKNMRQKGQNAAEAAKCLRMIESMELSLKKQCYVAECCSEQREEYRKTSEDIENELITSKNLMERAKKDLASARQVRRNRQEYAGMVRKIVDAPSRETTITKLEEIQEDLKNQQERQRLLELKLAERRNHLHAFNTILENFQHFISNDDELFADSNRDDSMEREYSPRMEE